MPDRSNTQYSLVKILVIWAAAAVPSRNQPISFSDSENRSVKRSSPRATSRLTSSSAEFSRIVKGHEGAGGS